MVVRRAGDRDARPRLRRRTANAYSGGHGRHLEHPGCAGPRSAGAVAAGIDDRRSSRRPRRTAQELARSVQRGRGVAEALRHLDRHGAEPGAPVVAEALARFLVARCESHHAGWRVVRQVVVDSTAAAPWERCARRAAIQVAEDLLVLSREGGQTPLVRAQHVAATRRAEQIAPHVDQAALLAELGLSPRAVSSEQWRSALGGAVRARSREQVARSVGQSLADSAR